ncbi:GNAT family N-acetyltransferase [Bacillus spongiae]|uniref:GNAT family N-acetyltransferase n=1 Tax=Bacillus spongiae TaxID=2683610 RepID=A0ABU8HJT0_9BACI
MRLIRFPEGLVIVEKGGVPIGQIELQIKKIENKEIGYVNLFYLTPEYREKGYGSILIDYAESYFYKHKLKEYQLRVSTTNQRAIRFYKKYGFNLLRIEKEETVPRYRMRKCLA